MPMTLRVAACAILCALTPARLTAQGLTLPEAIRLAQQQGLQATAATASLEAARARNDVFQARLLPQLSLNGTVPAYNRAIIPVLQPDGSTLFRPQNQTDASMTATVTQRLPTGGDLFVSSSLATLQVSGDQSFRNWSSTPVTVGIRQGILRPNTLRLDRREQPVRLDVAERQFREAQADVALVTTQRFFDLHSATLTVRNAASNVAINDTLFRLNRGRYEVGRIGENDLLQSELALLRARNALDAAQLDSARAEGALRIVLKLPPGAPLVLDASLPVPPMEVDTAMAVGQAQATASSVAAAELGAMQARRRVTEARLSNGVGATVEASYGFNATAPAFSGAYQNLLEARTFRLGVELPVLQWGVRRGTIAAAQQDQVQAEATRELATLEAAQEARFAALGLVQARRALEIAAKADTVAGKRYEVAYNRYLVGRIAVTDLYIAQAEKDQAVREYVEALRGAWAAHFRLLRVTGGMLVRPR